VDWMDLAQDEDWRRVLVNTVMNYRVPKNVAAFLSSCEASCTRPSGVSKVLDVCKQLIFGQLVIKFPEVHPHFLKHPILTGVNLAHKLMSYSLGPKVPYQY
jgi:hypothetical protein